MIYVCLRRDYLPDGAVDLVTTDYEAVRSWWSTPYRSGHVELWRDGDRIETVWRLDDLREYDETTDAVSPPRPVATPGLPAVD